MQVIGIIGWIVLAAAVGQESSHAIKAGRVLPISGEAMEPGMIWIEDGRIREIGQDLDLPDGVEVRDLGDRTVLPGLVDAHSHLGGFFDLAETVTAVTPGVRAMDALDPFDPDIEAALKDGITSYCLAPRGDNTFGGICAVVRGDGILLPEGGLKLSFARWSLRADRRPTSLAGAVALFREEAARARGGEGHREILEALQGDREVIIDVASRGEIATVLRIMREFDLRGSLLHCTWGRDLAGIIGESGAACIVGPLSLGDPREVLEGPGALEAAGVKVAFGSDGPMGVRDSLIITANLAVRHGMSERAALRALTLHAAEMAGVDGEVGSLERGKRADLLVLDGDPLDLSSRVEEVILGGETVYRREQTP